MSDSVMKTEQQRHDELLQWYSQKTGIRLYTPTYDFYRGYQTWLEEKLAMALTFVESDLQDCANESFNVRMALESLKELLSPNSEKGAQ